MPILLSSITRKHTVYVENQSPAQMEQVAKWGIHIFQTCDRLLNLIGDLRKTADLFLGGLSDDPKGTGIWGSYPTANQTLANVDFMKKATGYEYTKRKNNFLIDLQERDLNNGDLILTNRFDGVDQAIEWFTGGRVGHVCVIVTINGKKMVVESKGANSWPKQGIIKTSWSQWKEWAMNAGYNAIILPLNDEKRTLFEKNIDKVVKYFESMEGLPYGNQNFLFGWLDNANKNIPPVTTANYFYIVFSQLEKIHPEPVQMMLGEALNKRLGTQGLSLPEIASVVHDRNMTISELLSIPEQDEWTYSIGPSRVCSAFAASLYKVAGLFEGKNIQATEFTPRDIYQLNFYNRDPRKRPSKCKAFDPHLPYCQIMGNYTVDITTDHWNSIEPYDNMFEKCPSVPPLYERDTSSINGC